MVGIALNREIREGFSEEVTFGWRPERREGGREAVRMGRPGGTSQVEEQQVQRALKLEGGLRSSGEASVAGAE